SLMPLHHITYTPLAVPTCWHVASPLASLPSQTRVRRHVMARVPCLRQRPCAPWRSSPRFSLPMPQCHLDSFTWHQEELAQALFTKMLLRGYIHAHNRGRRACYTGHQPWRNEEAHSMHRSRLCSILLDCSTDTMEAGVHFWQQALGTTGRRADDPT